MITIHTHGKIWPCDDRMAHLADQDTPSVSNGGLEVVIGITFSTGWR